MCQTRGICNLLPIGWALGRGARPESVGPFVFHSYRRLDTEKGERLMSRRTRVELEAENRVLLKELEEIRDRIDELLEEEEGTSGDDETETDPADDE